MNNNRVHVYELVRTTYLEVLFVTVLVSAVDLD
jgi:hypothetical protein